MAPLNEYRKSYSLVCFITAILYALVAGSNLPVIIRITDGFVYCAILFSSGYALWNIFRFAIPAHITLPYRIVVISAFAIIACAFMVGVETLAIFLCFPASFASFVLTLPVRIFITFLLFLIAYLLYIYYHEFIEEKQVVPIDNFAKIPMDSSKTNENGLPSPSNGVTSPLIDRITVRNGQKIKIIPIDSIIYIKADGDYISIHTAEGKWLKEQTMKYTEDNLPANSFIRIHRSYIVNVHQISRIERYGEKQLIVLFNNEKIKISAARYQLLKQLLGI